MNEKEAFEILLKQVEDYDEWSMIILDSLLYKKELCKHPYPMGKKGNQYCMICNVSLNDNPYKVHSTWNNFDKQSKVSEAIKILKDKYTDNLGGNQDG